MGPDGRGTFGASCLVGLRRTASQPSVAYIDNIEQADLHGSVIRKSTQMGATKCNGMKNRR